MEELILNKSKELFFSYGLKSVSMDDIAKQAGISKKTIYQFFTHRSELVDHIVNELIQCHYELLINCRSVSTDAIDEVLRQSSVPFTKWASVSRSFFYELERSFPLSWIKLTRYRNEMLLPVILENLERGINEGLYHEDLDKQLIAETRIQQFMNALDPASFTTRKTNFVEMIAGLTAFYLNGITTQKGKKSLNKYLSRNEKKTV